MMSKKMFLTVSLFLSASAGAAERNIDFRCDHSKKHPSKFMISANDTEGLPADYQKKTGILKRVYGNTPRILSIEGLELKECVANRDTLNRFALEYTVERMKPYAFVCGHSNGKVVLNAAPTEGKGRSIPVISFSGDQRIEKCSKYSRVVSDAFALANDRADISGGNWNPARKLRPAVTAISNILNSAYDLGAFLSFGVVPKKEKSPRPEGLTTESNSYVHFSINDFDRKELGLEEEVRAPAKTNYDYTAAVQYMRGEQLRRNAEQISLSAK